MEYSKEDLMEAKKQIWGVGENMGTEESKKIWEENAQFCHSVFCRSGIRPFPPSSILNHSCAPRYACLFGATGER